MTEKHHYIKLWNNDLHMFWQCRIGQETYTDMVRVFDICNYKIKESITKELNLEIHTLTVYLHHD